MVEILNTGSTAWQHQLLRIYLVWVLCFHCDKVPKVTIEREKRYTGSQFQTTVTWSMDLLGS